MSSWSKFREIKAAFDEGMGQRTPAFAAVARKLAT